MPFERLTKLGGDRGKRADRREKNRRRKKTLLRHPTLGSKGDEGFLFHDPEEMTALFARVPQGFPRAIAFTQTEDMLILFWTPW